MRVLRIMVAVTVLFLNMPLSSVRAESVQKANFKPEDAMRGEFYFYDGKLDDALQIFNGLVARKDKDIALWSNLAGSVYLSKGDYKSAEDALLRAYYLMNDVSAFRNLEASAVSFTGSESKKAYKGDPYEKVFNSLYVSLLLYKNADFDNSLAAIKTSILADSDVTDEMYKSDVSFSYAMAARVASKLNDKDMTQQYLSSAKDAFKMTRPENIQLVYQEQEYRELLVDKQKALKDVIDPEIAKQKKAASKGANNGGNFSGSSTPAVADSVEIIPLDRSKLNKKVLGKIEAIEKDISGFEQKIKDLGEKREKNNAAISTTNIEKFIDPSSNVLLCLETGHGLVKYQVGQYGQFAVFALKPQPMYSVVVKIDQQTVDHTLGVPSDIFFQASTRGGRKMDGILKGKAQFKASTAETAQLFSQMSQNMTNQANQMAASNPYANTGGMAAAAGVMSLVSLGFAIASEMSNPTADIHNWSLLPAELYVLPVKLAPGVHQAEVEYCKQESCVEKVKKEWSFEVKATGDDVLFHRI